MSLRAATCHGGVLCPRLAFLQAQCGRCALDVTFFLPLSSFMLHRLNIQLDPKRRKLPAKQSHVYHDRDPISRGSWKEKKCTYIFLDAYTRIRNHVFSRNDARKRRFECIYLRTLCKLFLGKRREFGKGSR